MLARRNDRIEKEKNYIILHNRNTKRTYKLSDQMEEISKIDISGFGQYRTFLKWIQL